MALCAGVGGLELGLAIALGDAYRTVCAVERDAYAAAVLVARMEDAALDTAPVWDDLGTFDGRPWRGLVDILSGGYPCQPFSVAGKRRGVDDPRHLWPHIARLVEEIQPSVCFFENVPGHLRLGFPAVQDDLRRLGYRVTAGLFTAAEVGAPHRRQRLFILAYAKSGGGGKRKLLSGEQEWKIQPDPDWSRQIMAHTMQPGWEGHAGDGGDGGESRWEPAAAHRSVGARRPCPDVADTASGKRRQSQAGDGRPVFTGRSPTDGRDDWWSTEPGMGRVAHGVAHRVDRLRCCGNGVVPLQAAYALCSLWAAGIAEPMMEVPHA